MRVAVTIATALAAALAAPVAASAGPAYRYTTIADGGPARTLGQCPAINELGQVAFIASDLDPETFDTEDIVLRGAGGRVTTIAREGEALDAIVGNPSINVRGAVAFDAIPSDDDREVILRGAGGRLTEIARAGEERPFGFFTADVSLNSLGRVAFTGERTADFDEGLFEGSGGPVATRYLASSSPFDGSIGQPSLNELEQVASTTGPFSSFGFGGPSLNDLGHVAFQATLDDFASSGVFTGAGPVLQTGDTIGARTVASVNGCREMLNPRGQVALTVQFADGGEAILRADPRR